MTSYSFVHDEKPRPKDRPRRGKGKSMFTPKHVLEYEKSVRDAYEGPRFEGDVELRLMFHPDRTDIEIEDYGFEASKLRGDIDNYIKAIMDGLNGVAWHDDKQVHFVIAEKVAV